MQKIFQSCLHYHFQWFKQRFLQTFLQDFSEISLRLSSKNFPSNFSGISSENNSRSFLCILCLFYKFTQKYLLRISTGISLEISQDFFTRDAKRSLNWLFCRDSYQKPINRSGDSFRNFSLSSEFLRPNFSKKSSKKCFEILEIFSKILPRAPPRIPWELPSEIPAKTPIKIFFNGCCLPS